MSAILTIVRRELAEGVRNRWVVSMTAVMAALAGAIAALGSAPTGSTATGSTSASRESPVIWPWSAGRRCSPTSTMRAPP